jgi:peptidoglycan/LPS O-acetylase OafA/YrhL
MIFNAYSPIYFFLIAILAFLTSHLLNKLFGTPSVTHRESALDGLRGFLVIGVFVHHAAFWISKKGGAAWALPQGILSALGPVCVVLFFMTTAFLYYGKLLRCRGQEVDWLHIAVSRVLRLTPLCIVMAVAAFGVAFYTTGFVVVEDVFTLLRTFFQWASVGLGGSPDINGLKSSWQLNAGVVWTLKYEWLFYMSLPFFGIMASVKPKATALIISTLLIIFLAQIDTKLELRPVVAFLGGIVAAYATRKNWVVNFCQGPVAAIVFLVCVASALVSNRNPFGALSLISLTIAFVIVACNNNVFGILSLQSVRSFGDVGYSAYLLHGLLLYVAFHSENIAAFDGSLTPIRHWSVVACLTVLLVMICRLTFKYVEQPGMNAAPGVQAWIEKLFRRRRQLSSRI